MNDHSQYAEMLALYAIDALNAEERPELETHLRSCAECQSELAALRGDTALLALSAAGPAPPRGARQRLIAAIGPRQAGVFANQTRKSSAGQRVILGVLRPGWLRLAPVAVALFLAVFSLLLWRSNSRLTSRQEKMQAQVEQLSKELNEAQQIAALLKSPDTVRMTLVSTHTQPQPQVKTMYGPKMGRLLMVANNLNPLPSDKVYELWLLPATGGPPMPCGTFRPDASGNAMMHHPLSAAGIEASGFAITVEPEGGSQAPTSEIMMSSAG
ncbi:MAG TPA: anti-sigma factor [Candidatus Angelobacter sp.]